MNLKRINLVQTLRREAKTVNGGLCLQTLIQVCFYNILAKEKTILTVNN
jgi:hypothetical protein